MLRNGNTSWKWFNLYDKVVISQDYEDMEYMLRKLLEEYEKWGLKVNLDKTFYMGCGNKTED